MSSEAESNPIYSTFFGAMGATASIVFRYEFVPSMLFDFIWIDILGNINRYCYTKLR